jgi:TPR repeat protein
MVIALGVLLHAAPGLAGVKAGMDALRAKNFPVALEEFKAAAESGDPAGQYLFALMHRSGAGTARDPAAAAAWMEKSAAHGYAPAQAELSTMYATGAGVPKDEQRAIELMTASANQGYALAQAKLGVRYSRGWGVEQSHKKAFDLFKASAEQGLAEGQFRLALSYGAANGVAEDQVEALKWFKLAAAGGAKDARAISEALAKRLGPDQAADADNRAKAWLDEAKQRKQSAGSPLLE